MLKKGFTLLELMIVLAIIGILATIAIPQFIEFQERQIEQAEEKVDRSITQKKIEPKKEKEQVQKEEGITKL